MRILSLISSFFLFLAISLFGQPTNDTCEGAETFLSETPVDCSSSNVFIDIEGSIDNANPNTIQGGCQEDMGPTVWFKIEIDSDDASKLITQVSADGFDAVWAIYRGTSCADLEKISEQLVVDGGLQTFPCSNSDADPFDIFQTVIDPMSASSDIFYWVAVTAIGPIDNPNFTLTYASALPCQACSGADAFDCGNGDFTATVDGVVLGGDEYGDFRQGDIVEVCISFNYNTTGSGNDWFHGFVPTFGSGWDIEASDLESQSIGAGFEYFDSDGGCGAYLNGYDMTNICTYVEDGVLKLCNEACNPGGCPCTGGMESGDPLPSGWWINSNGGSSTCDTAACTPSVYYGLPSGTNVDVDFCLDLVVKEFETQEEYEQNKDLQIIVQTFSDAVSGCWQDNNACVIDPSIQGPSWKVNCSQTPKPLFSSNNIEICSGGSFIVNVTLADSSELVIEVNVEDNPNVIGETDFVLNGGGLIGNVLVNLTDTIEIVNYYVNVEDLLGDCVSPDYQLQVIVLPAMEIDLNVTQTGDLDSLEQKELCVVVGGGISPFTYEWSTGDSTDCILVQPITTTDYCVTVTDSVGCSVEECMEVIITSVNLLENELNGFNVFPNPSSGVSVIQYHEVISTEIKVSIYTIKGERMKVLEGELDKGKLELDLSMYGNGVYLLRIELYNNVYYERIVLL